MEKISIENECKVMIEELLNLVPENAQDGDTLSRDRMRKASNIISKIYRFEEGKELLHESLGYKADDIPARILIYTALKDWYKKNNRNLGMISFYREKLADFVALDIEGLDVHGKGLISKVERYAPLRVPILICGASGTSKESIAKLLHNLSDRYGEPYVAINCASLPETLIESELFGYKKGAFSGAVMDRKGYLQQANKGTLFLDELGRMPKGLQARLLRVIEEQKVYQLGSEKPTNIDIRVIAATQPDNVNEIIPDLNYRFPLTLELPTLSQRLQGMTRDVAAFYLSVLVSRRAIALGFPRDGKAIMLSEEEVDLLRNRDYKGNYRELERALNRKIIDGKLQFDEVLSKVSDLNPIEQLMKRLDGVKLKNLFEELDSISNNIIGEMAERKIRMEVGGSGSLKEVLGVTDSLYSSFQNKLKKKTGKGIRDILKR
ncbi:sigma 54-interacting transcriptional regulator [Nitrospirota bacterium]